MGEDEVWLELVARVRDNLFQKAKYRALPNRAKRRALDKALAKYRKP